MEVVPPGHDLDIQLHTSETYFDALVADIRAAGQNTLVSISTMGFDPTDQKVRVLLDELAAASVRGAIASLAIDSFSLLDKVGLGPVGVVPSDAFEGKLRAPLIELQKSAPNLLLGLTNYPYGIFSIFSPVYTGRSHVKSAVVGDKVYMGGISLEASDRLDAMVSVRHPGLALEINRLNRLSIIKRSVGHVLNHEDVVFPLNDEDESRILIDAGVRGRSSILDEALHIIDSAQQRITYASEQMPNGKIGRHLLAAHKRGVEVVIASNHPSKHDRYVWMHALIMAIERRRKPAKFLAHQVPQSYPTLHTKALANETMAMVGSHNLNGIGVLFGTNEIEFISKNSSFVQAVHTLIERQIEFGPGA